MVRTMADDVVGVCYYVHQAISNGIRPGAVAEGITWCAPWQSQRRLSLGGVESLPWCAPW